VPSLSEVARETILDSFFDLFNIRAPEWHAEFVSGRRLTSWCFSFYAILWCYYLHLTILAQPTVYNKRSTTSKSTGTLDPDLEGDGNESKPPEGAQPEKLKTNLVDQYLALLLVILATAGLFDVCSLSSRHASASHGII